MLTDKGIKALKPREKPYKVADAQGLALLVRPDGALWWRYRYRYGGREKMLSVGTYPDTSLADAREKRDEFRKLVAKGIDPSAIRKAEKAAQADTFEGIAREWLDLSETAKNGALTGETISQYRHRLATYVFPYLGRWPINDITAQELSKILRRIESRGTHETAHRVRSLVSRVFRYAVVTGRAERDPAGDLQGALAPVKGRNFAAITDPREIGALLRAIDGYHGQPAVIAALKLAPLVFVRPSELRGAEWSEFDIDVSAQVEQKPGEHFSGQNVQKPEWRIPGARMKMGDEHIVPLSTQAVAILHELHAVTGRGTLLFPSMRSAERPISENTVNAALRTLGYSKEQMTGHGFRTMASTRLNELGYPPDVIELQLAHVERNKVRSAYNKAQRLEERRAMMQAWADYLDGLKADKRGNVRAIHG